MKNLLLIDGHSILNRAFYGIPLLTNREGIHTNAVYGFINMMLKAAEEENAGYIAVAFDLKAPTFRHKMYDAYKGTRKPMPEELHEQVPVIKEILASMNIPVITLEGYEADDILGTLAKRSMKENCNVIIMSGDRDLLQLADTHIKIRLPKTIKGKTETESYYPDDVIKKYGTTPAEFIELKALMGDSSDNIPGVPGIGEKTAAAIISKYHTVENAYAHIGEITPVRAKNSLEANYGLAELSRKLAIIEINAPLEFDVEKAAVKDMFNEKSYELFMKYELKSFMKHFSDDMHTHKDDKIKSIRIIKDYFETGDVFRECLNAGKAGVSVAAANGHMYGVSVAYKENEATFISCEGLITEQYLTEEIKTLSRKIKISTINLKRQLDFITEGFNKNIDDTALMAYLINPLKASYGYEEISSEYMGVSYPGIKELSGKKSIKELTPEDVCASVFCYEAYTALYGGEDCIKVLRENNMEQVYSNIELPVLYVLRSMEKEGIRINRQELSAYGDKLACGIQEAEKRIYAEAGEKFNINSPKQLGEILFEKLGLPSGKKTKTGYSTSAEVLEKLADEYPLAADILEYRTLTKLKSTYADGLVQYISDDERIHGTFNQMITATGRISSTEPNLQNIPVRMELGRLIRKAFIPKEGYVFTDADYSQIELRLLAHMSGDETLIEAYNEDSDIHRITASKVFSIPLKDVTSEQRSNAKAVNFGIVYGISSFGLGRDLSISTKEAAGYIDEYFKTYPTLKKYLDGLVKSVKEKGYSETVYGRRRPVPEITSSNYMQRQFGERIAMNSPLQGTAADIIKIAMVNVYNRIMKENLKSRLILQIHDELIVETAPGEEDIVRKILKEEMENAAVLKVPLQADIHAGKNWYEAK